MARKLNKRLKSKKLLQPIPNWAHANELVHRVGKLQLKELELEIEAAGEIDAIKSSLAGRVKTIHEKIELHALSLEAFAESHRSEFKKSKSRKVIFGLLGWRSSTSICVKKTTLQKIKDLFTPAKRKPLIIVKETVDKNALAKLTDEDLARVGARRKTTDGFFVEPDIEVIDAETVVS